MKEVSVGIVVRDGRVLACQRRAGAVYALKWEFPGGKIEPGETPDHALRRELQEELAIEAAELRPFHRQEWVYPDGVADAGRDGSFRVFYYLVDHFSGEPVNRAFEQIRWVAPSELAAMDVLEGNREAIGMLVEASPGGNGRQRA